MSEGAADSPPAAPDRVAVPRGLLFFVVALALMQPLSVEMYLPALPSLANAYGVAIEAVSATVSVFFVSLGVGGLVAGPLSDAVGRKRPIAVGLACALAGCAAMVSAPSVPALLAARVLQGLGVGIVVTVAVATLRDSYDSETLGPKLALGVLAATASNLVTPTLGVGLLSAFGWQAIFFVLAGYGALAGSAFLWRVPETLRKPLSKPGAGVFRGYATVLAHRRDGKLVPLRLLLLTGFSTAVSLSLVTNAAFVYMERFGVSERVFALLIALTVLSQLTATGSAAALMNRVGHMKLIGGGLAVQIAATGGLLAASLAGEPTFYLALPLLVLAASMTSLVNPCAMAVYMSYFPATGGTATPLAAMATVVTGGLAGGVAAALHDGTLVPVAGTMAFASIAAGLVHRTLPRGLAPETG